MQRRANSVYSGIAKKLKNDIVLGKYAAGDILPPERMLKELFEVERTTVRRALEILCEEGLIEKRAGIGSVVISREKGRVESQTPSKDETEKIISKAAFSNRDKVCTHNSKPTRLLYAFCDRQSFDRRESHVIRDTLNNLEKCCAEYEMTLEIVNNRVLLEKMLSDIEIIGEISGIVFSEHIDNSLLELANIKKIPCVLALGRRADMKCVGINCSSAQTHIVDELYKHGHRKIAFVGGDENFHIESSVRLAFESSMRSLGLEVLLVNTGGSDFESGYARTRELLRGSGKDFTAICAVNFETAMGAVKALGESSKKIPEDVSVTAIGSLVKGSQLFGAYFDTKQLAHEICRSVYFSKYDIGKCGCYTELCAEICGDTVSKVRERKSGGLSDFLL